MKGGRTVSSGKSIAHILHHLIGAKIAGRVILLDGGRAVESERDGKPSPLSYRAGAGNVWIRSSSRPGSPRKTNLMHGIGRIEGRFSSISCGLGKSTPRRAQPEDRSAPGNLADARPTAVRAFSSAPGSAVKWPKSQLVSLPFPAGKLPGTEGMAVSAKTRSGIIDDSEDK